MPPPASTRWKYFTKGIHPNPPVADGRSGGQPHTPMHPCSNPKLFWVQCNFCISRNGGNFLDQDRSWLKSREEQMMHHLKTCCPESMQVWEEIMQWKAQRKGATIDEMKSGKVKKRGYMNPPPDAAVDTSTVQSPFKIARSDPIHGVNHRGSIMSPTSAGTMEQAMVTVPVAGAQAHVMPVATPMPVPPSTGKTSLQENTTLTAAQMRVFHRLCAIVVAHRKLDFAFFEDPVVMELFHSLRPGMVANSQLPSEQLLAGGGFGGETPNYIETYALEQVTNDMNRIVRSLKRYDGLKVSLVLNLAQDLPVTDTFDAAEVSSTLTCGGEFTCRILPRIRKATEGNQKSELYSEEVSSPVVVLASAIETQLRSASDVLGKCLIADRNAHTQVEQKQHDFTNNRDAPHSEDPCGQVKDEETRQKAEDSKNEVQRLTGLANIGSCLIATSGPQKSLAHPAGSVQRVHGILAYRWPMIAFFSHGSFERQMNLLVKDVLTKLPGEEIQQTIEMAFNVVRGLQKVEKSAKWNSLFIKVIVDTYFASTDQSHEQANAMAKTATITTFCWSAWTQVQYLLASLIRIKTACTVFTTMFSTESDFYQELRCCSSPDFWISLERAELLFRPLVRAATSFVPEKGMDVSDCSKAQPTMADLVHIFYWLYNNWISSGFLEAAHLAERRWKHYENPWMMLAFIFHPAYIEEAKSFLKKQNDEDGLFSSKLLSNAMLGYAIKYLASEMTADPPLSLAVLKRQASDYMEKLERGEINATAMHIKGDWKEYWNYQTSTPELSKFVLFLLSVSCQASTVDDLFQSLATSCVRLGVSDTHSTRSGERGELKDHLVVLAKAAKPMIQKWRMSRGLNRMSQKPFRVLDPEETLPVQAAGINIMEKSASDEDDTSSAKQHHSFGTNDTAHDPDLATKQQLEDKISARIFSSDGSIPGLGRDTKVADFWLMALNNLADDDLEGATLDERQHDKFEHLPQASTPPPDENDDTPQFTLPAYAKANSPANPQPSKVRRVYRPEQVDFDFMKGWRDTRDEPITSLGKDFVEENVSQLQNYRANKIKLADFFFENQIPESFQWNVAMFDV